MTQVRNDGKKLKFVRCDNAGENQNVRTVLGEYGLGD